MLWWSEYEISLTKDTYWSFGPLWDHCFRRQDKTRSSVVGPLCEAVLWPRSLRLFCLIFETESHWVALVGLQLRDLCCLCSPMLGLNKGVPHDVLLCFLSTMKWVASAWHSHFHVLTHYAARALDKDQRWKPMKLWTKINLFMFTVYARHFIRETNTTADRLKFNSKSHFIRAQKPAVFT